MQTVTAPASVRDQAFSICRAHGLGLLSRQEGLEAGAAGCFCDAMIALETVFRIDLDPDELWPSATTADLVALVERKVSDKGRLALLACNDDFPGQPAPFVWRRPIVAALDATEHRDRARRARHARKRRQDLAVVARLLRRAAMLGAAMGALAFSLGWL